MSEISSVFVHPSTASPGRTRVLDATEDLSTVVDRCERHPARLDELLSMGAELVELFRVADALATMVLRGIETQSQLAGFHGVDSPPIELKRFATAEAVADDLERLLGRFEPRV